MGLKLLSLALKHRGVVTATLLFGFVLNLLVIGVFDPPSEPLDRDLPVAAQCQGGGPGCSEQPLIPPPAVGLPRFDAPVLIAFGVPAPVQEAPPDALRASSPAPPDRPPLPTLAA